MNVLARVENRIWSDADSAHKHVEIRVQWKVLFSIRLSQVEVRLIYELCFVDCVLHSLIFEKSCALCNAQVNWRCYTRPWFVGALGAPGSTLACLIPSEWDRPPSVTEGAGNPTADQKTITITITIGVGSPRIPTARCTTVINTHGHLNHNTFSAAFDWKLMFGAIVAQVFSSS